MLDNSFALGAALYGLWIAGIVLALYLMLTERPAANKVTLAVISAPTGFAFVTVLVLIAQLAGAQ
ncbi:hypothetical protein [Pararhizobium sp.]|uniref:hypothetical protein n=1 Tax=Pararhizobium sp. TaxID=1977563 RepID=UPI003D109573